MEKYEILEQIGNGDGEQKKIYKVKKRSSKRILACKEINYGRMSEKEKQ